MLADIQQYEKQILNVNVNYLKIQSIQLFIIIIISINSHFNFKKETTSTLFTSATAPFLCWSCQSLNFQDSNYTFDRFQFHSCFRRTLGLLPWHRLVGRCIEAVGIGAKNCRSLNCSWSCFQESAAGCSVDLLSIHQMKVHFLRWIFRRWRGWGIACSSHW